MDMFLPLLTIAALFFGPLMIGARVMNAGYRRRSFGLKAAGFLLGPALFFAICYTLFVSAAGRATQAGEYVCGAFGALALVVILGGSVLEVAGALVLSEFAASKARQASTTGN